MQMYVCRTCCHWLYEQAYLRCESGWSFPIIYIHSKYRRSSQPARYVSSLEHEQSASNGVMTFFPLVKTFVVIPPSKWISLLRPLVMKERFLDKETRDPIVQVQKPNVLQLTASPHAASSQCRLLVRIARGGHHFCQFTAKSSLLLLPTIVLAQSAVTATQQGVVQVLQVLV